MAGKILAAPPTDRSMWRRLLALVHPDRGGDHDLFVWASALREHVAGELTDPPIHERPLRTTTADTARVPYPSTVHDFDALTRRALDLAREVPRAYAWLLELLSDCRPSHSGRLLREQGRGASYRRLAAIGHLAEFDKDARGRWYRVAEEIPLSDRHAGHILSRLKEGR